MMISSGDCARVSLTSRPKSAGGAGVEGRTPKRQWNAPPSELFPRQQTRSQFARGSARKPSSALRPAPIPPVDTSAGNANASPREQRRVAMRPEERKSLVPPNRAVRTQTENAPYSRSVLAAQASASLEHKESSYNQPQTKRGSHLTGLQVNAIARGCTKRLSQVTWARLQKVTEDTEAADREDQSLGASANEKYSGMMRASELEASDAQREERQRSYLLKSSMNKQDVYPEDVRPLIDIAYSSPFIEVRRDAAAALASLSRNGESWSFIRCSQYGMDSHTLCLC